MMQYMLWWPSIYTRHQYLHGGAPLLYTICLRHSMLGPGAVELQLSDPCVGRKSQAGGRLEMFTRYRLTVEYDQQEGNGLTHRHSRGVAIPHFATIRHSLDAPSASHIALSCQHEYGKRRFSVRHLQGSPEQRLGVGH